MNDWTKLLEDFWVASELRERAVIDWQPWSVFNSRTEALIAARKALLAHPRAEEIIAAGENAGAW